MAGLSVKEGLVSVRCEPKGKRFDDDISADGMVTRWNTGEIRHTITVVLKGASKENMVLSALHQADCAADNGAGVFIFSFTDEQGALAALTDQAWITGFPGVTKAVSPEDISWELTACFDTPLSFTVGGN